MNLSDKLILRTRITAAIIFIIWCASLWYLSSRPVTLPKGPEIPHLDKIAHFGFFALGSLFLGLAFKIMKLRSFTFLCLLIALSCYGALDEWHQSFIPERSGNDKYDWLADFFGSLTGLSFTVILLQTLKKIASRPIPTTN